MTRTMVRRSRVAMLLAVAVMLLGTSLPALAYGRHGGGGTLGVERQLARVRGATFKYRDVNAALADGYTPIPIKGAYCVEHPTDGSMGIHYLNPALVDGTLDPPHPELLLYFPTRTGLRLVGVEYFTPDTGQPHPEVLGQMMHGPNATLLPEIPVHCSLHAWIWFPNPSGVFADYNPRLDCP